MIPLRLQLRNFMCYGETATLALDGVRVACLSGDNGHGKSALLDAMTWAIWGRARAKSDDDLIQIGKTEMEVEFEFAVGRTRYRVIRKRVRKGKRGVPTLEFQIRGPAGYMSITASTLHETQRKIGEVLRMEYETFVNSALLLQGRADEFTVKSAAERKKVLAEVLGLAIYDGLEEAARERARNADVARRELSAAVAEIERELVHWPEYLALRDRVGSDLAAVELEVVKQEGVLRRVREAKQELENKQARIVEIRSQLARERRQLDALTKQILNDRAELAANLATLAEKEIIEQGYQRLLAIRALNESLAQKATNLLSLASDKSVLEQRIARARHSLESEIRVALSNLTTSKAKMERRPALWRDLAATHSQLENLAHLEDQRDDLRGTAQVCRLQIDRLKTVNERLKEDMALLKEKIDVLSGDGAACPVCESELGPAGRKQLSAKFRGEGEGHAAEYRQNAAQIKQLEARMLQAERETVGVEQQLADRERLRRQAGFLERTLAEVDEAERVGQATEDLLGQLYRRLEGGDFAPDDQQRLAAILAKIESVGYDATEHERIRGDLARLAPFQERRSLVQAAETVVGLLGEKVRQNEENSAHATASVETMTLALDALAGEVAAAGRVGAELAAAEKRLDELDQTSADLRMQLGRAEQLLTHCEYLEQQRGAKGAAFRKATEEKAIYDELALAFGKKGIQAMIIDSAIPEIEEEANLLLARLTDNRMHVKLETQREAKSGDSVIETLDIKIADEMGYRQYEMYSGGEAFRVNFAIRIALSKLLARRAGARLQTLIIDEGFGTQDSAGRERLVEAINSVSDDFECIIVITHIQELKDAFPLRIDVVKGAEGSQIVMTG